MSGAGHPEEIERRRVDARSGSGGGEWTARGRHDQRSGHQALRVDHLQADLAGRSMRGGAVTVGALDSRSRSSSALS